MNFWKEFLMNLLMLLVIISMVVIVPVTGIGLIIWFFNNSLIFAGILAIVITLTLEALCITYWLHD